MAARPVLGVLIAATLVWPALLPPAQSADTRHRGGGPVTYEYPSTDCPVNADHGLQDCIDNAAAGDIIVLNQQVIDENAEIGKSLTLKGKSPSLGARVSGIAIHDTEAGDPTPPGGMEDIDVKVIDVESTLGVIVNFSVGHRDSLLLRHVIAGKQSATAFGIDIDVLSPADVTVENSFARTTQTQGDSLSFFAQYNGAADTTFRAVGNNVTGHKSARANSGIDVSAEGKSRVLAFIENNRVWDTVHDNAGNAAGIALSASDKASMIARVVGNSVNDVGGKNLFTAGLSIRNDSTAPAEVRVDVFNNVFSHIPAGPAMNVSVAHRNTMAFHAGYNDSFAVGQRNFLDGFSAGRHNLKVDPQYVDAATGDLHVKKSSKVIDAGQACTSGGLINLDAWGNGRLHGANVDMGASELGAKPPSGIVVLGENVDNIRFGTKGADIMCGFGGSDRLLGRGGNDYIDGGSGRDKANGGAGADRIIGATGPDTLLGAAGNDALCGLDGRGTDVLRGGAGTDRGRFDSGDHATSIEKIGGC